MAIKWQNEDGDSHSLPRAPKYFIMLLNNIKVWTSRLYHNIGPAGIQQLQLGPSFQIPDFLFQ